MSWYLHVFWGLVVFLSVTQLGRAIAAAGEWVAKSSMKNTEAMIAFQREEQLMRGRRGGP